jgi:serine protease Do
MPIPVPGSVAEKLRRQTVQIRAGRGRNRSGGSGLAIVDERVITNAHVVCGEPLVVEAWDGREAEAACIRLDRRRDLGLLSVRGLGADAACLGDSDRLRPGTPVFAVGNPLGFVGAVSSGVVHAIGPLKGFASSSLSWIQADLRLAPGNSGGPMADFHGNVLGINSMVVRGGLALAIPSRAVQAFVTRAKTGRRLGVTVQPVELATGKLGILILEIVPDSGAAAASLLPGDILAGADGRAFRSLDDLEMAIDTAPGAVLRVEFYRGGQQKLRQVAVRLTPAPLPHAA